MANIKYEVFNKRFTFEVVDDVRYIEPRMNLVDETMELVVRGAVLQPVFVEELDRVEVIPVEDQANLSPRGEKETVVIDAFGKYFVFDVPADAVKRYPVLDENSKSCVLMVDDVVLLPSPSTTPQESGAAQDEVIMQDEVKGGETPPLRK